MEGIVILIFYGAGFNAGICSVIIYPHRFQVLQSQESSLTIIGGHSMRVKSSAEQLPGLNLYDKTGERFIFVGSTHSLWDHKEYHMEIRIDIY